MYRWHKFVPSQWLMRCEATLQEQTNNGLVVIQSPNRKRLRLEVASASQQIIKSLLARFGGEVETLPRNWRDRYAASATIKSLRIGTRLTIHSTRTSKRVKLRSARQLIIPAGGAFGTGDHPTTAMCLRLIERVSRPWPGGWKMFDAGTGSGILALAARCFGARNVSAIDSDPKAIAVAKANARANRIDGIRFRLGDATRLQQQTMFHIIAANLYAGLLIAALPAFERTLRPCGLLILSGILREQEQSILRALRKTKMTVFEIRRRGKWIALLVGERGLPACSARRPAGRHRL